MMCGAWTWCWERLLCRRHGHRDLSTGAAYGMRTAEGKICDLRFCMAGDSLVWTARRVEERSPMSWDAMNP